MPAKRIAPIGAILATALTLAATALAGPPKSGTYTGLTSGPVILGFAPPVSFTLSTGGKALTRFRYSTFGCGGFGGDAGPGLDDYLMPYAVKNVGKVPLSSDGRFAVNNVRSTYKTRGQTTVTITSISGKFTSKAKASGTITFSQTFSASGHAVPDCGPASVTFSAERM